MALFLAAGCSKPEPTPLEQARERQQRLDDAQARMREYEAARTRAAMQGGTAGPSMAEVKHELLAQYGAALTPLQQSALLGAQISSREEGEKMCLRWIDENRRFESGGDDR